MVFMRILYTISVSSVHLSVKLAINQLLIVQVVILKEISKIYKLKIKLLISIHVLIARMVNLKINKIFVNNVTPFVKLVLIQVRHV
jgi:hypothetical protein